MVYADYEYYVLRYGGSLEENAFDSLIKEASRLIDSKTNYKAEGAYNSGRMAENIKIATCSIIDILQAEHKHAEASQNGAIQAENNDGYSVTYKDGTTLKSAFKAEINEVCERYLTSPINLLLRWL